MNIETASIKELIQKKYDLGEIISITNLESGHESDNISIKTTKGKFVLKFFSKDIEDLQESIILQELLLAKGVKLPHPIKTRNNELAIKSDLSKVIAIQSYVPGEAITTRDNKGKMFSLMSWFGKNLGEFHYLSKSITNEEIKSRIKRKEFFDQTSGLKWMIKIFENAEEIIPKHEKSKQILKEFKIYLTETERLFKSKITQGIIQSDIKPGDFFAENKALTGILDFNNCFYTYLMNELGTWIMYTSLYKPENKNFFQDFIKSYLEHSKVPISELKYIPLFLKGRAFVQFFYFAYRIFNGITQGLEEGETNMDGFQDGIDLVEQSLKIHPDYFYDLASSIVK